MICPTIVLDVTATCALFTPKLNPETIETSRKTSSSTACSIWQTCSLPDDVRSDLRVAYRNSNRLALRNPPCDESVPGPQLYALPCALSASPPNLEGPFLLRAPVPLTVRLELAVKSLLLPGASECASAVARFYMLGIPRGLSVRPSSIVARKQCSGCAGLQVRSVCHTLRTFPCSS